MGASHPIDRASNHTDGDAVMNQREEATQGRKDRTKPISVDYREYQDRLKSIMFEFNGGLPRERLPEEVQNELMDLAQSCPNIFALRYDLRRGPRHNILGIIPNNERNGEEDRNYKNNVSVLEWALGAHWTDEQPHHLLCAIARAHPGTLHERLLAENGMFLPIHILLKRRKIRSADRFDTDLIRCFVELYPQSLWIRDDPGSYFHPPGQLPIHFACHIFAANVQRKRNNPSTEASTELIEMMLEQAQQYCGHVVHTNLMKQHPDYQVPSSATSNPSAATVDLRVVELVTSCDHVRHGNLLHFLCLSRDVRPDWFASLLRIAPKAALPDDRWDKPVPLHTLLGTYYEWREEQLRRPERRQRQRTTTETQKRLTMEKRSMEQRIEQLLLIAPGSAVSVVRATRKVKNQHPLHLLWSTNRLRPPRRNIPIELLPLRLCKLWLELYCWSEYAIPRSMTQKFPLHSLLQCYPILQMNNYYSLFDGPALDWNEILTRLRNCLRQRNDRGLKPLQIYLQNWDKVRHMSTRLWMVQAMLDLEPGCGLCDRTYPGSIDPCPHKRTEGHDARIYHPLDFLAALHLDTSTSISLQAVHLDVLYRLVRADPEHTITARCPSGHASGSSTAN